MAATRSTSFIVDPRTVALACGLTAAAIGATILVAWATGNEAVKQVHPDWPTMKANTALGFVSLGLALALCARGQVRAGQLVAGLALAIGVLTLAEYVLGADLGIDELLFDDDGSAAGTTAPGRLAILSAGDFILLALALVTWPAPTRAALGATLLAGFVALFNLSFFFLDAIPPIEGTRMAVHTAGTFLVLAIGLLTVRSQVLGDLFVGRGTAAQLARRLLLPVVAIPLLAGWLAARWGQSGDLDAAQAAALALFADLAVMTGLVGYALVRLHRESARAAHLQADLSHSLQRIDEAERVTGRGSWELDPAEGRAWWSAGMYRLHGVDPATFANTNEAFLALVHPDDRERMRRAIADAVATPGPFHQEYRVQLPDGRLAHRRADGNVATGPDGATRVLYGVVVDITHLRELEEAHARAEQAVQESEDRLRTIFTANPAGIIISRRDGSIVDLNPAAERLWGLTREQFLAPTFRMEQLYADPAEREPVIEGIRRDGRAHDLELRMRRGDGSLRRMLFNVEAIEVGGEQVYLGSGQDITALREAQERALEAEARLRAVLDNATDAIVTGDATATIVGWNKAAERIFGRTPSQALGAPIASLLTPEQWADYQRDIAAYMQGQASRYVGHPREMQALRRDGSVLDIEMSLAVWTSGSGPMFTGVVRDITERKETERAARRAQERFASIFAGSPLAISLSSAEGRLLDVNPAFVALSGYDAGELLSSAFHATSLYAEPAQRDALVQDLRAAGKVTAREFRLRRKDGSHRAVLGSLEFLDMGGSRAILGMFQDVTALNDARAEREARLASEAELERLRRADLFRADFINNTAHELKTPLTPLVLAVWTLSSDRSLGEAQRRSVEAIERNVSRLRRLVDDLLGAADIQARTLELDKRRLNLTRELRAAVAANAPAAERAGVALEEAEDAGLSVSADPARLQLVLGHLIGNAIKFTPSGGRVTVAARREGEDVRVSVTDTGIGLAAADVEALWRPFSQAHDKSQRTDSGHGLGLFVAKGIVELHGGEVGCSSPGKGKGSTFWFRLPLAVGHVDPLARPKAEAADAGPRRNLNPGVRDD